MNFGIIALSALVPLVMGFIWYNPKTFGTIWQREAGVTDEQMKNANMGIIFGVTLVFSFLLAMAMQLLVIHQVHVFSIFADTPGAQDESTEIGAYLKNFMDLYGKNFRTFKHGAFHGFISGIFVAMPIFGINALFERKSFKYIWIHTGYWAITMCLMGGIISQWA
jgi:hypothetical protein